MRNFNDILFLLRAKGFGELPRLLVQQLSDASAQVAVLVDERKSPEDCAPYAKISLDERGLAMLGLTGLPENWGRLCGDSCYYLAAKPKRFSRGLRHFGIASGWGCIFPLTSVQSDVVEAMKTLRMAHLNQYPEALLNDEGILAGVVAEHGFSYAALEDVAPEQVNAETFNTNPPHLFEALRNDAQERRVFHPVVDFQTILDRLVTGEKAYTRRRLRNVIRTAPENMKQELLRRL